MSAFIVSSNTDGKISTTARVGKRPITANPAKCLLSGVLGTSNARMEDTNKPGTRPDFSMLGGSDLGFVEACVAPEYQLYNCFNSICAVCGNDSIGFGRCDVSEERVVLITGSATGLGAALIRSFAGKGFGVVINHLIDGQANALGQEIEENYGREKLLMCRADVADRVAVRAMYENIIGTFGRIDILINCAGINRDGPFAEMSDESWDSVISAHLKGHFVCGQEFVRHNPDREGVIINMGAAAGSTGRKNGANFCAAKAGVLVLTKCMALELAPRIRVNCLVPGSVKTDEVSERYKLETDEGLEKELATLPLGRLGEFEDVTRMVHCIVDSNFTTGAKFFVNGGQYMH